VLHGLRCTRRSPWSWLLPYLPSWLALPELAWVQLPTSLFHVCSPLRLSFSSTRCFFLPTSSAVQIYSGITRLSIIEQTLSSLSTLVCAHLCDDRPRIPSPLGTIPSTTLPLLAVSRSLGCSSTTPAYRFCSAYARSLATISGPITCCRPSQTQQLPARLRLPGPIKLQSRCKDALAGNPCPLPLRSSSSLDNKTVVHPGLPTWTLTRTSIAQTFHRLRRLITHSHLIPRLSNTNSNHLRRQVIISKHSSIRNSSNSNSEIKRSIIPSRVNRPLNVDSVFTPTKLGRTRKTRGT
jgi:hypothetical protein